MIDEMTLEQVIERMAQLDEEVRASEDLDFINSASETKAKLEERKAELEAIEARKAAAEDLNAGKASGKTIDKSVEEKEEKRTMERNSVEYRDAFFANLLGNATEEQRAIFADNTNFGDGVALPVTTDEMIWDQVTTDHPILRDISVIRSGVVMKVTKSTPAAVTGKKDSAASSEQTMTNVDVVLAGIDFHTYVCVSFAEAKMSVGAMEKFLAKEIADALGEALAKHVFSSILTGVGSAAATKSSSNTYFACLGAALGAATQAANAVIYAPASLYYGMLAEVDANGQPIIRDGVTYGRPIKVDNAATKITVLDPKLYILNVVQDVAVEAQKDLKAAQHVIGGYCRAEGTLRKTNAAAYVG